MTGHSHGELGCFTAHSLCIQLEKEEEVVYRLFMTELLLDLGVLIVNCSPGMKFAICNCLVMSAK